MFASGDARAIRRYNNYQVLKRHFDNERFDDFFTALDCMDEQEQKDALEVPDFIGNTFLLTAAYRGHENFIRRHIAHLETFNDPGYLAAALTHTNTSEDGPIDAVRYMMKENDASEMHAARERIIAFLEAKINQYRPSSPGVSASS